MKSIFVSFLIAAGIFSSLFLFIMGIYLLQHYYPHPNPKIMGGIVLFVWIFVGTVLVHKIRTAK